MPLLAELVVSSSLLGSMRELGTRLSGLRKLWACHCQLSDLEGIGALPRLAELHLAHNAIEDLQPLQGGRCKPARSRPPTATWHWGGLAGRCRAVPLLPMLGGCIVTSQRGRC
jgi:Leucine-rich repeat (LRR) protein